MYARGNRCGNNFRLVAFGDYLELCLLMPALLVSDIMSETMPDFLASMLTPLSLSHRAS